MKRYVRLSFLLVFLCATVVLPQSLRVMRNGEIWNHSLYSSKPDAFSLAVRYNNQTRYAAIMQGTAPIPPYSVLKLRYNNQTLHVVDCAYRTTKLIPGAFGSSDFIVGCSTRLVVGQYNSKRLNFYDHNGGLSQITLASFPNHAAAAAGSDEVYILLSDKYIVRFNILSGTSTLSFTYNFSNPVKIALGSSAIFVADRGAGRVFKFSTSGTYVPSFEVKNLSDIKAICTLGGYIFVANGSSIAKYSSDGTLVASIASPAPITDMNQWGNTICLATTSGIYRLRSDFSLLGSTPASTSYYSITFWLLGTPVPSGMLVALRSDGIWRID